jgi:hypothetical protein
MSTLKKSNGTSGLIPLNPPTIWGDSVPTVGVAGTSDLAPGVQGLSRVYAGVWGVSDTVIGTFGTCRGDTDENEGIGVAGYNGTDPIASDPVGILDAAPGQCGVYGLSDEVDGVVGASNGSGRGVWGQSTTGIGVSGYSETGIGVSGFSESSVAVYGSSDGLRSIVGVVPSTNNAPADAIAGVFSNFTVGIGAKPRQFSLTYMQAADFLGHVNVVGDLFVEGTKGFKIDHPLDPANKTLKHCAVESPDMKTFYDGVVRLDRRGRFVVKLPSWFCALNKDFRYQLTSIGKPSKDLHIASEISDNRFTIGGEPGARVCWQVTGTRQDAWANAYRMKVEERKGPRDRGRYGAPHLFPSARGKKLRSVLKSTMLDTLLLQESANHGVPTVKRPRRAIRKRRLAV